jgi:hypothetical protein
MPRVPSGRFTPADVTAGLGLLAGLAGTWRGRGFNLIARPDYHDKTDLYLQLNHTRETLVFEPIGSVVPNRGFGQDDIQIFGLTYLQKISDAGHDGALHIEPGIWITQPNTVFPLDNVASPSQLVARMGNIPHGNSILAQGVAEPFNGTPVLKVPGAVEYAFSKFPSFNSTPFAVPPTAPGIVFNAAGSSEKLTAPTVPATPFPQYDLSIPPAPAVLPPPLKTVFNLNTRTPFETAPPEPAIPNTPENQDLINDPITLLQNEIESLIKDGYTFSGFSLNIASQIPLTFLTTPNSGAGGPTVSVNFPQAGGGVENIQFLGGVSENVGGKQEPVENAQTAVVYATFWVETVTNKATGHEFIQLQYAQTVLLNFPIFHLLNPPVTVPPTAPTFVNLGWPHVSVATLRKTFG